MKCASSAVIGWPDRPFICSGNRKWGHFQGYWGNTIVG